MATHQNHDIKDIFYFVTFTCYKWMPLIAETNLYDYLIPWSKKLESKGIKICGYVIMPNHIHLLIFVENKCKNMNKAIGESKRFMAYEIVKRLKKLNKKKELEILSKGVQLKERVKGKKHQVFRLSFDAKELRLDNEIVRVLDYIHHNPVNGKWSLTENYLDYPHSSARFYELGKQVELNIFDFREVCSESSDE